MDFDFGKVFRKTMMLVTTAFGENNIEKSPVFVKITEIVSQRYSRFKFRKLKKVLCYFVEERNGVCYF